MTWDDVNVRRATEASLEHFAVQLSPAVLDALLILSDVIDSDAPIVDRLPAFAGHAAIMKGLAELEQPLPVDELAEARRRREARS